jgi:hypothetical protein
LIPPSKLTHFRCFRKNVVVWIGKQNDSPGPEGLGISDGAGGAVEGAVGLDHDDGVAEVVVVEPDHVVKVGEPAKVAIDKPAFLLPML